MRSESTKTTSHCNKPQAIASQHIATSRTERSPREGVNARVCGSGQPSSGRHKQRRLQTARVCMQGGKGAGRQRGRGTSVVVARQSVCRTGLQMSSSPSSPPIVNTSSSVFTNTIPVAPAACTRRALATKLIPPRRTIARFPWSAAPPNRQKFPVGSMCRDVGEWGRRKYGTHLERRGVAERGIG